MQTGHTINEMVQWRQENKNKKIAFVGTMGNLHAGHLALVEYAKSISDKVVVSIFVNPLQFSENEDFGTYPRSLAADSEKLKTLNTDFIFAPTPKDIYPNGLETQTQIFIPELSHILCGISRPHFFQGVATVVGKLFNIIKPNIAIFGEKDFQQLLVIKRMVADLHMNIEIIGRSIVREADGLALSSRNQYLSPEDRKIAINLYSELKNSAELIRSGERDFKRLSQEAKLSLSSKGFKPDYYEICREDDLSPVGPKDKDKNIIILTAAYLGKTRLIDNIRTN